MIARAEPFYIEDMTLDQAKQIRKWRCEENRTWRGVAQIAHETFGGAWLPTWNQLVGMGLCEHAAKMLGEDPDADPWN